MSKSHKTNLLIVFFLLLVSAAFWHFKVVNPSNIKHPYLYPHNGDMYAFYQPKSHFAFEALKHGHIPLWNPYESCGEPFLANLILGIFYPLNYLHLLMPTHLALGYTAMLHIFLSGAFMFLFARFGLSLSPWASLMASITFMLSSFVVINLWYPVFLNAIAWAPLLFLLTQKVVEKRVFPWAVALALALALQLLTGGVQYCLYTYYGLGLYTFFIFVTEVREWKHGFVSLLCLASSFALALLLSSVQILPTLEASLLSTRPTGGLSLEAVYRFGAIEPKAFLWVIFTPKWVPIYAYIGLVPLLLSLFAPFLFEQRARAFFFLFMACIGAFLSFGFHTPLYALYHSLPTGDWFRVPQRFLLLFVFPMAVLSGMGLKGLVNLFKKKPLPCMAYGGQGWYPSYA